MTMRAPRTVRAVVVRRALALSVLLVLGGCGDDGMDDLREFVEKAHAGRAGKVDPLPEIKTQETFSYTAAKLSDPFATFNLKPLSAKAGTGPRPDMNRRREPLEEYPLDALKMVGTLTRGKEAWVVILAPDGTVHRASVGNHLGQNFGTITRISEDKVNLIELIQGAVGDWVEREASVALAE